MVESDLELETGSTPTMTMEEGADLGNQLPDPSIENGTTLPFGNPCREERDWKQISELEFTGLLVPISRALATLE